ncbi:MAG: DNA repair protein RecN [Verrucomicrobia bacterium]|nr:DNA repair protein RecN [Verrucomicrobiota bacterium]
MLTTLRIKNLALVTDLTLELRPGYNAISGETGAGKSIILGALNLVLGERADRSLIRSGSDGCSVEAVFDITRLASRVDLFLEESGLDPSENGCLFLKRSFSTAGANRQFINGSPTTVQSLAKLGSLLVDIHGPHDHQSLLYPNRQLAILDAYGQLEPLCEEFGGLVRRKTDLEKEKAGLIVDDRTFAQQLDLLRFQVSEIDGARLDPDEEATVEAAYRRSSHITRILELVQSASGILSDDENGVLAKSGILGRTLSELKQLDPEARSFLDLHTDCVNMQNELLTGITHYADRIDTDPEQHQHLEERSTLFRSLRKKYGPTLAAVISFGEEARSKLGQLERRDTEVERINREIEASVNLLNQKGRELSALRCTLIPKLSKAVARELSQLGFAQSRFDVAVDSAGDATQCGSQLPLTGFDSIEFQFAPNKGEPSRSLRSIASSGELARVMLALKTVLAKQDEVSVLLFDEVDANVGGETARVVGEKMRQIARDRQVLCITHLAPVAAAADSHYVVTKQVKSGRTHSDIRLLEGADRIAELARMLGGVSQEALKHAEALLSHSTSAREM